MHYERTYWVNWTWHYVDKKYCYSEAKCFETSKEATEFLIKIIDDPSIKVVWCKKTCEEIWEKKGE